jgi:thiol:disulfide interchange protein DsbD
MRSKVCSSALLLFALVAAPGRAQAPHVVSIEPAAPFKARRGGEVEVPLRLMIRGGYHINSSKPAEDYLIPTLLTWAEAPLSARGISYPKAESVKYDFSAKPLLVYSGTVAVVSRFQVPPGTAPGEARLAGKLRYQACNDKACLPPRTLDVSVSVNVE